jgi:hypothetical protein
MPDIERVVKLLHRELRSRGIQVLDATDEGRFVLEIEGAPVTVGLEELLYDFEREGDPRLVARFVSALLETPSLPPWSEARSRLFLSLEPQLEEKDDRIVEAVTDSLRLGITHADEAECVLRPLREPDLRTWQLGRKDVFAAARSNMAILLDECSIESRKIGTVTVATFATRSVFKPALIFSPNFKQIAAPKLGWPILAFVPCREMVYLVEKDGLGGPREVTGKFLSYMVHEFVESRYGLTTEVLMVSDEGVTVAGVLGVWE